MKEIKVFLIIMLNIILLTGCKANEIESNGEAASSSDSVNQTNESTIIDESDKIDINLYLYGPDDYDNPIEMKVISVSKELFENNIADALNYVFEETVIRINSADIDKETHCITVDIPQEIAMKFNAGSTAGVMLTNTLIDTILNLPDIQSAVITVDGVKDSYADHYSFQGTFTKEN